LTSDRGYSSLSDIPPGRAHLRGKSKFDKDTIRRAESILLIRPEGMGDIILTLPAIAYLRRENSRARLAIAVRPIFAEFVREMQVAEEIIPLDYPKRSTLSLDQFLPFLRQVARLRRRFDVAFDFRGDPRNVLIGAWSAPIVAGPGLAGTSFLLAGKYADPAQVPMAERNLRIVSLEQDPAPAIEDYVAAVRYRIDDRARQRASCLVSPKGNYVLIHPGASRADKQWNPDKWRALIARYLGSGEEVVITGSGKQDSRLTSDILAGLGVHSSLTNLVNRTNCADLTAIVERARLVISPDTGVAHIAFAYNVPSVTLFGSDSEVLWGHKTPVNMPLRAPLSSPGTKPGADSINALTVDQVFSAASQVLLASFRNTKSSS
jgi:ADP-heptose:LPS heptosyltransferase